MKRFLPIILLCGGVLVCVLALTVNFSDIYIRLSLKKYHEYNVGDRDFEFYGSFGKIYKINVYEDGDRVCSLRIDMDARTLDCGEEKVVELCDVNSDGTDDLLVLRDVDADGDVHRSLFIGTDGEYISMKDTNICNFRFENERLVSEEREVRYLAETVEEYTVPFESYAERKEYVFIDGEIVEWSCVRVSYYSESDVYCIGTWEYDIDAGELLCVEEDWLDPDDYMEQYEHIAELFDTVTP